VGGSTISPDAVGTIAAGAMQFMYDDVAAAPAVRQAAGQSVLQATAPGQVLSAAAGADVLADAGGFGVTFQGTVAGLAREMISGFSVKDLIDVTDLNSAGVATSYAGSGNAGVLYLTDGTLSGELQLAGQLAGESFHVTTDGHGGTSIGISPSA
jgi:hypothetical protein